MLSLLLACGQPSPQPLAELAAARGREAFALCAGLSAAQARAACQTTTAAEVADEEGLVALSLCAEIEHPVWRDECVFLSVDHAGAVGEEALEACAGAGEFVAECSNHAVLRELQPLWTAYEPGTEQALYEAALAVVTPHAAHVAPESVEGTAGRHVAHFLGVRSRGGPFTAAVCGTLEDALCARVYWESLEARQRSRHRLMQMCALERPVAADAERIGTRPWREDIEEVVRMAWRWECTRPQHPAR